jgi:hypothetical protein
MHVCFDQAVKVIIIFKEDILLLAGFLHDFFFGLGFGTVHLLKHYWIVLESSKPSGCIKCWNFLSGWATAGFLRGILQSWLVQ